MFSALNAWSVDPKTGFPEMFQQLKAAGFQAVELNVDAEGKSEHALTFSTTDSDLDAIAALSREHKLPVCSISTSLTDGRLGTGLPEDDAYIGRLLERQLYCAQKLGANGILTVPGGIGAEVSIARAYRSSRNTLRALRPLFDTYKLPVGLENVWNTFFTSPFDMASFVDGIDSPHVGAYYDVGNSYAFSPTEYWIDILGPRISHVHVKGFRRAGGNPNRGGEFTDTLDCGIRWDRVFSALRQTGYRGAVTVEISKGDLEAYQAFYRRLASELNGMLAVG